MDLNKLIEYCLTKKGAYTDLPFGPQPICIKIKGKIFAQFYTEDNHRKVSLKCERDYGEFFRQQFPGVIVRGYFCPPIQQPYWNTVYPSDLLDETLWLDMIDHAYTAVVKKLPKKTRMEYDM